MRKIILTALLGILAVACSTQHKLNIIRESKLSSTLSLAEDSDIPELLYESAKRETMTVMNEDGKEILIMRASLDENGEMVANDVIEAAKVTATFRNVAERQGKVNLSFDVTIPKEMQDSKWQLRFRPDLIVLEDRVKLDSIIITGRDYRKAQLRGHQLYDRFLSSIITDTAQFYMAHQLETFLKRNLPAIYKFKKDTSFVADSVFESYYGVTEKEAVDHYTKWLILKHNEKKKTKMNRMYEKYVKAPIISEGLRLDSVIVNGDQDIVYRYTQTINAKPELRKADVVLSGEIYEQDKCMLKVPDSEPLTFYISSISSFVDERERYLTKVTERRVDANTSCNIDFKKGDSRVERDFGRNEVEIGRIRNYLLSLMENRSFDLDSIIVSASSSPEGSARLNENLSQRRAESVSYFFSEEIRHLSDSLKADRGAIMDLLEEDWIHVGMKARQEDEIRFIARSAGENWNMLQNIVSGDTLLSMEQKNRFEILSAIEDLDERELKMKGEDFYGYLFENAYPKLRTVRFDFHLHRKGMVKDTVHTTVVDSNYMDGIQALKDMDYSKAVTILRPYMDYNVAVAYCAMGYNASAMDILENLQSDGRVEYLKAIIHSRNGDHYEAVQCYLNACSMNRSFINRGNLDPEISGLIRTYNLNNEQ